MSNILNLGKDLYIKGRIGWKGLKTAKRLVEEYLVRIESGSTFSGSAKTN